MVDLLHIFLDFQVGTLFDIFIEMTHIYRCDGDEKGGRRKRLVDQICSGSPAVTSSAAD